MREKVSGDEKNWKKLWDEIEEGEKEGQVQKEEPPLCGKG